MVHSGEREGCESNDIQSDRGRTVQLAAKVLAMGGVGIGVILKKY